MNAFKNPWQIGLDYYPITVHSALILLIAEDFRAKTKKIFHSICDRSRIEMMETTHNDGQELFLVVFELYFISYILS